MMFCQLQKSSHNEAPITLRLARQLEYRECYNGLVSGCNPRRKQQVQLALSSSFKPYCRALESSLCAPGAYFTFDQPRANGLIFRLQS